MDSPVNQAAHLAKERVNATAVSIYEQLSHERRFFLTGCIGWSEDVRGPASELVPPDMAGDGVWRGLTSFVAFENRVLRIANSQEGAATTLRDGTPIHLAMDRSSCEITDPGPFLAVPILASSNDVLGVIRATRREREPPFDGEDEERLTWVARFLALSFVQERMRAKLIEGLMGIVTCDKESGALERIAAEAEQLLNHPSVVFLRDGTATPARYTFRAPQEMSQRIAQKAYTHNSGGYTPLVLFKGRSHVLSLDLGADTLEGGPLHGMGHEPKCAELGHDEARSFVAVPIPGPEPEGPPAGVIRSSSRTAYAFSRRDVETMRALASQAAVVLRRRQEQNDRDVLFQTIVDTSPRPILAIDARARVKMCNEALCLLLNRPRTKIIDKPLLEVAYANNLKLARANKITLEHAGAAGLRSHFTLVYRESLQGRMTIPVRVDASYLRSESGEITGAVAYLEDLRGPHVAASLTMIGSGEHVLMTVEPDTAREMQRVGSELREDTNQHILISGETGVGKEQLAHAVAAAMMRPDCKFLNCAGLDDEILETDLFGVKRKIATGLEIHEGFLRPNARDTIVLDEIQELSLRVQAKLLRVLDTGKFRPLGAPQEEKLGDDLRFVALTNVDLDAMEKQGRFRNDLKHRLLGITFHLKPLRERRADIMQLADYFLAGELERNPDGPNGFSSDAIRAMLAYHWPGNVRELKQTIRQAFTRSLAMSSSALVIQASMLPEYIRTLGADQERVGGSGERTQRLASHLATLDETMVDLKQRLQALESKAPLFDPSVDFTQVLTAALAEDKDLGSQLVQGSIKALRKFFVDRMGRSPKKSQLYKLLATIENQKG
jgi:transcriptional regulator with PAS, ATPase and Fis domain